MYPPAAVVIVDDTMVGIEAGLNAGMLTVAVTQTGNSLGLSEAEVEQLPTAERQHRLDQIEADFRQAGAHFVIRSVAELPELLQQFA